MLQGPKVVNEGMPLQDTCSVDNKLDICWVNPTTPHYVPFL